MYSEYSIRLQVLEYCTDLLSYNNFRKIRERKEEIHSINLQKRGSFRVLTDAKVGGLKEHAKKLYA